LAKVYNASKCSELFKSHLSVDYSTMHQCLPMGVGERARFLLKHTLALMSRFALIVRSETVTGAERVELFRKMLYRRPKPIKDIQKFDQWVQMAREFVPIFEVSKEIEDKYIEYCSRIVDEHLATELRRDLRMGMYITRIPICYFSKDH